MKPELSLAKYRRLFSFHLYLTDLFREITHPSQFPVYVLKASSLTVTDTELTQLTRVAREVYHQSNQYSTKFLVQIIKNLKPVHLQLILRVENVLKQYSKVPRLADEVNKLQKQLTHLRTKFNKVIQCIHAQESISKQEEQTLLGLFTRIKKDSLALWPKIIEGFDCRSILGSSYFQAYCYGEAIEALSAWLKHLEQCKLDPSTLKNTLKIKKMLHEDKTTHFKKFYSEKHTKEYQKSLNTAVRVLLTDHPGRTANDIIQILRVERSNLRKKIVATENALCCYPLLLRITTSILRLGLNSIYYQLSSLVLKATEELLLSLSPILASRVHDYLLFFRISLALLFLGLDIYTTKWMGLLFSVVVSVRQLLLNDITRISDGCRLFSEECDERSVVTLLNRLGNIIGWFTYVALCSMLHGASIEHLYFFSGRYLMVQATRWLIGYSFKKGFDALTRPGTHRSWLLLAFEHISQQYVGFSLGTLTWSMLHSSLQTYLWRPSEEALFNNSNLCTKYSERCQRLALARLDLKPEEISKSAIRQRARLLSRTYHPDKGGAPHLFKQVNQARDRLLELLNGQQSKDAEKMFTSLLPVGQSASGPPR